jgi:hypothetical protein
MKVRVLVLKNSRGINTLKTRDAGNICLHCAEYSDGRHCTRLRGQLDEASQRSLKREITVSVIR